MVNESNGRRSAVSGSCKRCGCPLSHVSTEQDGQWFCCGACAGSDRCTCGCHPDLARPKPADADVPTRRMFASRHPDGLKTKPDRVDKMRAFPFADRTRGR